MQVYRVKNWDEFFENFRSRKILNCSFVCVPNKQHGEGFLFILSLPDGLSILGCWLLILEACSLQKEREGWMTNNGQENGQPWTAKSLSFRWRRTLSEFERALEVLTSKDVSWIEVVESATEVPALYRKSATEVSKTGYQSIVEGKGREGNRREENVAPKQAQNDLSEKAISKRERTENQKNAIGALWIESYKTWRHAKYRLTGRDKAAIRELGTMYAEAERNRLKRIMEKYLQDADPWLAKQAHPLFALVGRTQKYETQINTEDARKAENGDGKPEQEGLDEALGGLEDGPEES